MAQSTALAARDAYCVRYYKQLISRRGTTDNVSRLVSALNTSSIWWPPTRRTGNGNAVLGRLAVVVRGQAYRGRMRQTFSIDAARDPADSERDAAQARCTRSIVEHIVEPFERSGHTVRLFLTLYEMTRGSRERLIAAYGAARVASVQTLHHKSTASQILPVAAALADHLRWCRSHAESFDAVILTRHDIYLKADLYGLLGAANRIFGVRFLWHETGGHWRHHANPAIVRQTFQVPPSSCRQHCRDWRKVNARTPDALVGFAGALTNCLLHAALAELLPPACVSMSLAPGICPINFLHNVALQLRRAIPDGETQYLVRGGFDSNPCRATCMLNPVYDLLPRMEWVRASRICQSPSDFRFDPSSQSLCCPSPTYCCPNHLTSCDAPSAEHFDVISARVPIDAIERLWPTADTSPYRCLTAGRSLPLMIALAITIRSPSRGTGGR